jgi:DNA replication protein DnaC
VYIDDVEDLDDINASITKNNRDRKEILLDPLGNVPLKRYEVTLNNINKLSTVEWKSSLVLTEEERDVVETKGTVLLLGRSGTGKDWLMMSVTFILLVSSYYTHAYSFL